VPDTLGQVQFESTNDTVVNGLIHFGKDDANTIQLWGTWGANRELGGYGINPNTYPYYTGNPAYSQIYQQTPALLGVQQQKFGIPILNPNVRSLNLATAAAIVLFEALRQVKTE